MSRFNVNQLDGGAFITNFKQWAFKVLDTEKEIKNIYDILDNSSLGPRPLIPESNIVDVYADLPNATSHNREIWFVSSQTGIWALGTRRQSGFYVSQGGVWRLANDPLQYLASFEKYLFNVEYTGTDTVIATGDVLEADFFGQTVYRFISNTENSNGYPSEDSFYSNFDGVNLTGLIVQRNSSF